MPAKIGAGGVTLPGDPDEISRFATGDDRPVDPGRIAEARSVLAAIDATVFSARRNETRRDRRRRTAAFVTALFSDE
jgi:hypothetical protein